jgi:thioredoxin reductase (NADPH)
LLVAAGVGAFVPRKPPVTELEPFHGTQVHYPHDAPLEASLLRGKQIVVMGGDESALVAALEAADTTAQGPQAGRVTLVHRRDVFAAEPATLERFSQARAAGLVHVVAGQTIGCTVVDGQLTALRILAADESDITLAVDQLLVRLGVSPKMGPIADWGWTLERKQVPVNTETFQSGVPGLFAVGDINFYPGKRKLILSGFHEATLAAFGAMAFISPERKAVLQYTTTSPRLHQLLGVGTQEKN